jgi:hypothetical protein
MNGLGHKTDNTIDRLFAGIYTHTLYICIVYRHRYIIKQSQSVAHIFKIALNIVSPYYPLFVSAFLCIFVRQILFNAHHPSIFPLFTFMYIYKYNEQNCAHITVIILL